VGFLLQWLDLTRDCTSFQCLQTLLQTDLGCRAENELMLSMHSERNWKLYDIVEGLRKKVTEIGEVKERSERERERGSRGKRERKRSAGTERDIVH
jgi:hypothetical protein